MLSGLAIALTACGESDEEQIRDTARAYLEGIAAGSPDVCEVVSTGELARIAAQTGGASEDPVANCAEQFKGQKPVNPAEFEEAAEGTADAELSIEGDSATMQLPVDLSGDSPNGSSSSFITFIRQEDEWKVDGQG